MGIGVAAADDDSKKRQRKPNSIVTCVAVGPFYGVGSRTAPASVNLDQCSGPVAPEIDCSPCIRSLENQGCKVVEAITNFEPQGSLRVNFLLSCAKP